MNQSRAIPARMVLLLILVATLAAACNPDRDSAAGEASAPVATTIDTIGSVVHVTSTGVPPQWQLTQVASIGPETLMEEETPEEFASIFDVALGPDGAVYVADRGNHEVRVFGVDGAHRFTFGREGEGPGEFDLIYSAAWIGDRLLALDSGLGRLSEFSADGEYLGQRRIQGRLSGGPGWVRLYPVGADEAYLVEIARGRTDVPWRFVGLGSRELTGDTLLQLQGPRGIQIHCERGGNIHFFQVPFAPELVQHPGPGGVLYSAMSDAYRIAVTRADGDTVRVIERTLPAEPITDEEWAEGNEDYFALKDTVPLIVCDPLRPPRPDSKPFIAEMYVASDGKLWVEVVRSGGNRWEAFDTEGRLVASMPAPTERRYNLPPAINAEHVLTVRRGLFDVDHVDVWRIERGG